MYTDNFHAYVRPHTSAGAPTSLALEEEEAEDEVEERVAVHDTVCWEVYVYTCRGCHANVKQNVQWKWKLQTKSYENTIPQLYVLAG